MSTREYKFAESQTSCDILQWADVKDPPIETEACIAAVPSLEKMFSTSESETKCMILLHDH